MTRKTPRALLIEAASALALSRGGMWQEGPLIGKLGLAMDVLPHVPSHDPLHDVRRCCGALIEAKLVDDAAAYSEARAALAASLAVYWGALALDRGAA